MTRLRIGFIIFSLLALIVGGSFAGKGGGKKPPPDEPPADPAIALWRANPQHGQEDLMVMNADGTNLTVVLAGVRGKPGRPPVLHRNGAWSPDAERLVFERKDASGVGIYTVDIDGSNVNQLVAIEAGIGRANPAWSPDSTADGAPKVAYVTGIAGGWPEGYDVYVVDPDGDGSDARRLAATSVGEVDVSWSPTADRIAVAATADGAFVYDLGLVGGELAITGTTLVTAGPLEGAGCRHIQWAKTQDKLVVTANGDLWVIDLSDLEHPTRLTNTEGRPIEQEASWSPDDAQIVFHRSREDYSLYTIDPGGAGETLLLPGTSQAKYHGVDWRR